MPRETVTLALNPGAAVALGDFVAAMSHFDRLLRALAQAHRGKDMPEMTWRLDGLAGGSAVVTASAEHPAAAAAADGYLQAARCDERESRVQGKRVEASAGKLLGMLGSGIEEMRFETSRGEVVLQYGGERKPVDVPLAVALGEVEGVVETLSRRRGLKFTLYEPLFDRPVSCYVREDSAEHLRGIWGKRVIVEGRVSRDPATGSAVAIRDITAITPVVPTAPGAWRKTRGAIKARPGSPPPEEIVRKMRDAR